MSDRKMSAKLDVNIFTTSKASIALWNIDNEITSRETACKCWDVGPTY